MRIHCVRLAGRLPRTAAVGALLALTLFTVPTQRTAAQAGWLQYGHDSHHSAISSVAISQLQTALWQTPVDLAPPYNGGELFIHYGTPLVTAHNTVIVTVRTSSSDTFQVEGHDAYNGALMWTFQTDYILPQHDWTPSCGCALTPNGTLYVPGAGGTVWQVTGVDTTTVTGVRQAFYDVTQYNASEFANVRINTPITADTNGNIYYGFFDTSTSPLNFGGLARIDSQGHGSFIGAAQMANDNTMVKVVHNCAPALSLDEKTLYVAVNNGNGYGSGVGYLTAVDSTTLEPRYSVFLKDPGSLQPANAIDDGTATPAVGPDGDVYYGVLDYPWYSNIDRGWMLHFSSALKPKGVPGRFGWDDTASIVPAKAVPSYTGTSKYLLLTKYNNYANTGGDGNNLVAVLDPNGTEANNVNTTTNTPVMKEVITVLGVTPNTGLPGVREWCINTAAIDPITKSAVINSEDGNTYRWDLTQTVEANKLSQVVHLTQPTGEAYTPTVIGTDGTAYSINNATLWALGPNIVNVSKRITVAAGKLTYNKSNGHYTQVVTLTNNALGPINGTVNLVLDVLSKTATLFNAKGVTVNNKPIGSPYVAIVTGGIAQGAAVQFTLDFVLSKAGSITYKTRILAGTGTP